MSQGVRFTKYDGYGDQILAVVDPQVSFGCIVSAEGVTANADGRKIIKAGTPLTGSLTGRDTPFKPVTLTTDDTTGTESSVTGVLLHDADVTYGDSNSPILVFGFVKEEFLSSEVKALWTDEVKKALNAKVTLINLK